MRRKILLIGGLGLLVVLVVTGSLLAYVRYRLPNVPPQEGYRVEATPDRIERGRHLAHHVAACMDCHSPRDWSRFSGPIMSDQLGAGGEVFDHALGLPGRFTAKNLTPANLADWSDAEIHRAIVRGVSRDGTPLFPIMPWPNYATLDDDDIQSIIAYLRTIAPVQSEVPPSEPDFPVNLVMRTMPRDGTPRPRPDGSNPVSLGRYLVTAAACADCHTPMSGGQHISRLELAGGTEFPMPGGAVVIARNLTPDDETGIGQWTEGMFVQRFRAYADGYESPTVPPGGFNTPMPWTMYAHMTEAELKAIYAYLGSLTPIRRPLDRFRPGE